MLNADWLAKNLPVDGLGRPLHVHERLGSTNAEALALASAGAVHGTLVVADEQTAGRGRGGRRWLTPPGTALAVSLVLRPKEMTPEAVGGMNVLGALAVVEALAARRVTARIKWPNDVVVEGRKIAGVLAEASWTGEALEYVVLGIGVNVLAGSAPPDGEVEIPATSLEAVTGRQEQREPLLVDMLKSIAEWCGQLGKDALRGAWERHLAHLGEPVQLTDGSEEIRGRVRGIATDGRLLLEDEAGRVLAVPPGAAHLRPVDSPDR
jgi:BirA family biotin operon repressor/biotin-[acetyl-CoA-carboxylase] ligase